ncbi:MAG: DUF1232 domain-containing protein [Verrucomicrobia bacterium]|nr:DUF1232 domain-containing protein [Verrucomicrobiota bacterium]
MKILRFTPKLTEIPALVRSAPAMFRDLFTRKYRRIPVATLVGGFLGFLYILNPLDLIPDALPIIGIVDDTLVFGVFLTLLGWDVKKHILWKETSADRSPNDDSPTRPTSR